MNCSAVRKYLFAFADDQLDVKISCDVLDHVKMCRDCGRLVDEHQSLRTALGRTLRDIPVPSDLRDRVAACIAAPPESQAADAPGIPARRRRLLRPAAAAAALGFLALAAWQLSPSSEATINVPRSASAASRIADVHHACCGRSGRHHSAELPRDIQSLSSALGGHYHGRVTAVAPNLSRFGFDFESASFCPVRKKRGCESAHLIYVRRGHEKRVSFFSMPRWDCLDKCGARGILTDEGCRQYAVDEEESGQKLFILAWHQDATTYICCGLIPLEELRQMVREVRLARGAASEAGPVALLHHRD